MNCKPDELAIVISGPRSAGRIVRTIRLAADGDRLTSKCGKVVRVVYSGVPNWIIDGYVYRNCGDGIVRLVSLAVDSQLRPLRDNPGEDESFRWAPSPTQKELA